MARELAILREVRGCEVCRGHLPNEPRPVLQAGPNARILVIGQAPGRVAHETRQPWNDRSGDRLRDWLGVSREVFYDVGTFALVPMGFCFPGTGTSGDMPPRPECAPLWHGPVISQLKNLELTLLVGTYPHRYYLKQADVTAAVRASLDLLPTRLALPHPSPRNTRWLKDRPWFEREILPALKARVQQMLR